MGGGRLRVVTGDVDQVLAGDRVVVMAEWSPVRDVRPSALQAAAYAAAGWPTLIVSARDPWTRLRAPSVTAGVAVVSRPNSAYDFGSWRDALGAYPQLAGKDRVVLTNDSLEGPVGPLDELLRRIEGTEADMWSVTGDLPPRRRLHSYLLAFSGVACRESRSSSSSLRSRRKRARRRSSGDTKTVSRRSPRHMDCPPRWGGRTRS